MSKGDYNEPKTLQGSLVAHQPLELLCIDFTKVDVLVLMDTFSKYSQAFVTSNQKAFTVAKLLVDKWFNVYGIPFRIYSDQGRSFDNEIIAHLCHMYGVRQSTKHSKAHTSGKELLIAVGNHVLLHDHPEGRNKIQDKYKSDIYVFVGHHQEPKVYYIQLLSQDHKSKPKVVNRHQLYDLNQSISPSASQDLESRDDGYPVLPCFLAGMSQGSYNSLFSHPHSINHYNTHSKLKAATAGRQAVVESEVTHL